MKKIKVSNEAGLLATIAHTLGFTPAHSFVLLTLNGNRVGATLRVDAPDHGPTEQFTATVVGYLLSDTEADGAIMAIYTDVAGAQSHSEHVNALELAMMAAGMPIRTTLLVTGAGWKDYTDATASWTALESITDSTANAEMIFAGSNPESGQAQDRDFTGAPGNGVVIAALAKGFTEVDPLDISAPVMREARSTWSNTLGTTPDTQRACLLAAFLQNVGLRDRLMADLINTDEEEFENVLLGQITTRPTWERAQQGEALLVELLTQTPHQFRAPLYTMLGFISWYKGRSSTAATYMAKALESTPDYRQALLFEELMQVGYLPAVATNREISYPGEH